MTEHATIEQPPRENGFYWVLTDDEVLHVGEWNGFGWLLTGSNEIFYDDEFISINAKPIQPPQVNK